MSDEADALAEMARNRGFKLVRSRVRTPTKRAFGKYGLEDRTGKALLGLDGKHPCASADEVETFLRKGLVSDWAESLGVATPKVRKSSSSKAARKPAPRAPPPPTLKSAVRAARPADAQAIVELASALHHAIDEAGVRKRLKVIGTPQLVATLGDAIVGLCGLAVQDHIHRSTPVGRITILIVAKEARGQGLGRMLVEEAQARLAKLRCGMIEATSNNRLADAHHFYAHLGFEQTSKRFAKSL